MSDVEVKMAEFVVTGNADRLTASGIGSCVVVTLYDPKLKIGGLAHAMLPSDSRATEHDSRDCKYVDVAIAEMLREMTALGSRREDVEAKLIGCGNMFAVLNSDIGKENVLGAKEQLKKEGIKLVGESVGGSIGRSVEFSVASGIVTVRIKF